MNCLACPGAPLEEKHPVEGLVIDLCAVCGGTWLDAGELERFAARAHGFQAALERAANTLLPTPQKCPRCLKVMDRGWIAEAEVEFKLCPDCKGIWLAGEPLRRLRAYLKRSVVHHAAPPARPRRNRAVIAVLCAAVSTVWMCSRGPSRPGHFADARTSGPGKAVRGYERDAVERRAQAALAETHGYWAEAEEGYSAAGELYAAAIQEAATPQEAWRLEMEYAKAGEPIARMAVRRNAYAESEEIQMVRLAVFERHHDLAWQARVWQEMAEALTADARPLEAVRRFNRAASLHRAAGNRQDAEYCRQRASMARMARRGSP